MLGPLGPYWAPCGPHWALRGILQRHVRAVCVVCCGSAEGMLHLLRLCGKDAADENDPARKQAGDIVLTEPGDVKESM